MTGAGHREMNVGGFWPRYARGVFWYSVAVAGGSSGVQVAAYCGWPLDQPFLCLVAALVAFVLGMPCWLRLANSLDVEARRRFGWQYRVVFRRAARWTCVAYVGSVAYMGVIVYLTMPSWEHVAWVSGPLSHVMFSTGLSLFTACASLMTCSAVLRTGNEIVGRQ